MPHRTACGQTEMAGKALKAVEFALEAAIVAAGRRPRAWKDPAALAAEAGAVSTGMPALDPGALARAANHNTGTAYPGLPGTLGTRGRRGAGAGAADRAVGEPVREVGALTRPR